MDIMKINSKKILETFSERLKGIEPEELDDFDWLIMALAKEALLNYAQEKKGTNYPDKHSSTKKKNSEAFKETALLKLIHLGEFPENSFTELQKAKLSHISLSSVSVANTSFVKNILYQGWCSDKQEEVLDNIIEQIDSDILRPASNERNYKFDGVDHDELHDPNW